MNIVELFDYECDLKEQLSFNYFIHIFLLDKWKLKAMVYFVSKQGNENNSLP